MTVTAAAVYRLDPLRDSRHRNARAARDLADWLAWLELGNAAARTLDAYERYAAGLLRAFPDKTFAEFTDGDLAHVLALHPPKSRHIVKAAWNNWFRWGYKTRRIAGNPVDLLPQITYRPLRQHDVFTEAETEALCALPTPDGELMTLLLWVGLRRGEARLMTGKRLALDRRLVIVIDGAKRSKERHVPMIGRVAEAAAQLLTLEGIGRDDYLWAKKPGGGRVRRDTPISNTSFDTWWSRCLADAGVRHRRPHMARHTFSRRMRALGLDLDDLKEVLGHDSIRTTVDQYGHPDALEIGVRMRALVGDDE